MATINVYADGVYDLLHPGHLAFLSKAKALGDRLLVGVHNDEDVATYKHQPVIEHRHRVEMLEACRLVDKVIPNAPLCTDEAYLKLHQIDLVVHGDDTAFETYYAVPLALGIMRYVPYTQEISTTLIQQRVIERHLETRSAP
ncbi:MAG: adenylyltransferase/cytidyltransferase family protein [Planctomycetota bacterium]